MSSHFPRSTSRVDSHVQFGNIDGAEGFLRMRGEGPSRVFREEEVEVFLPGIRKTAGIFEMLHMWLPGLTGGGLVCWETPGWSRTDLLGTVCSKDPLLEREQSDEFEILMKITISYLALFDWV